MTATWDPGVPLYRQIQARLERDILAGDLAEGAMLPSVRQVAADWQVNPLTVARAYQGLADAGLTRKHRGVGASVMEGAATSLRAEARKRFLHEEWPALAERIRLLGIALDDLPADSPAP